MQDNDIQLYSTSDGIHEFNMTLDELIMHHAFYHEDQTGKLKEVTLSYIHMP